MASMFVLILLAACWSPISSDSQFINSKCISRSFGSDSVVCVCTGSKCDNIPRIQKPAQGMIVQFTSSKGGLRFAKTKNKFETKNWQSPAVGPRIQVRRKTKFQEILGFGGAFTDAATINIKSLSPEAQDQIIRAYYAEDGLEYNIGRVPIAGSDFSTREYSYADIPGDVKMNFFQLAKEDTEYKIPLIHKAISVMPGPDEMFLTAAAWSSPPWMKTSHRYSGFGLLKPEYYQAYADYHLHFLDAYAAKGLKFWSISTGNEPLNGILPINHFNALGWTPSRQGEWIRNNFGPSLRNSVHNQTKIIALDDQRVLLHFWVDWLLDNKDTLKYVDGIGVHWYTDIYTSPRILDTVHKHFPNKFLLYTEACVGSQPWEQKVVLGSWSRAELVAEDIISVLHRWVTGWIDWNLALDPRGSPNWAKNFADSPIIVNATSGEFYKQPLFYAHGHFSKFIPRGSVRIAAEASAHFSDNFSFFGQSNNLAKTMIPLTIAFERPDGAITLIIMNKFNLPMKVELIDDVSGATVLDVPARSLSSIVYV